jgi:ubiquinone biosynthesis protein COQ9
MQIEKLKAKARENRLVAGLMAGPLAFMGRIKAPEDRQQAGMPGRWQARN